jgi:hypothetical protein
MTAYHFAVATDFLNRSLNFHLKSNPQWHSTRQTLPLEIRLFHQTLVLVRHEMGLDLSHEIHYYNNNDQ